ncbi:proton channel OTOP1-like [Pelodytes ibericus]
MNLVKLNTSSFRTLKVTTDFANNAGALLITLELERKTKLTSELHKSDIGLDSVLAFKLKSELRRNLTAASSKPSLTLSDFHLKKKNIKKKEHKNSEISSIQYGINIFIVGSILMLICALNITGLKDCDRMVYLIMLVLIQVLWMLWYIIISDKKKWACKEKDSHAGARWLRCGMVLFAMTTLVMDFLKLGYFVGYVECMPIVEGIYPATHIVHTIVQVYFIWYHSKDVIMSFKTLERFGLIHSVFTNLLLWASAVTTESKHQLKEHMGRLISLGFENLSIAESHPECNCSTEMCDIFSRGIYYIYPFNIEYHILASAMLYVLWKNIGNNIKSQPHKTIFNLQGVAIGTILGIIVFAITIGVVVIYLFNIGQTHSKSESALIIYYLYSISVLMIMCVASLIGLLINRLDRNLGVLEKSPAIKLDGDLLVGSACGSWLTSWGSILAVIYAVSHPAYTWYNLPYSILVLLEKYVQNLFIITFIHRKIKKKTKIKNGNLKLSVIRPQRALSADRKHVGSGTSDGGDVDYLENNNVIKEEKEERDISDPTSATNTNPGNERIKKMILKNLTVILFLSNISLWIPPAFGCRPQYDNGLEADVFGIVPWIIVVDVALPFSIFYRMHSAYSLFDVYCNI